MRRRYLAYILLFICSTCSHIADCQVPLFRNLSVENGLPSSEVYYVMQDSKGYVWFATDGGVCRYDGSKFRHFSMQEGLTDNTVFYIQEDSKGKIWFYSFSNRLFYFSGDRIHSHPKNEHIITSLRGRAINSLYVDKGDTIWLGMVDVSVIYKISPDGKYGFVKNTDNKVNSIVIQQFEGGGSIYGRYYFNPPIRCIDFCDVKGIHRKIPVTIPVPGYLKVLFLDCGKGLYALTIENYLIVFNEHKMLASKKMNANIISLSKADGAIWVGLRDNGIIRYENAPDLSKSKQFLASKSVTGMLKDKEGGYWFSTLESGVFYTPSLTVLNYTNRGGALSENKISGITGHLSGDVFFSISDNTLWRLHEKNISQVQIPEKFGKTGQTINKAIFLDEQKRLWTGRGSDVLIIKPDNTYNLLIADNASSAYKFYPDNKGTMWYCCINGLMNYHPSGNGSFELSRFNYANKKSRIRGEAICELADTIYIGTLGGLWGYRDHHYFYLGKKYPLLSNRITDITKDKKGRLWFATRGAGILVKDHSEVYQVTDQQGLIDNICNAIVIDPETGVTWVATNKGISAVTITDLKKQRYRIHNYNKTHGIISSQVNDLLIQHDRILLATNLGLCSIDKKALRPDTFSPPVYITQLRVNDKKRLPGKSIMRLNYDENNIQIKYTGVAFKNIKKVAYRYKLAGIDHKWIYTDYTTVRYPKLSPGNYEFVAEAANNDGYWSETPAKFHFFIARPFWQHWWFISALVLFTVACTVFTIRFRIKKIEQREQQKTANNKRLVEMKLSTLKAQMSPHFTYNTLNAIQYYISSHEPEIANEYLSKFTDLMRSMFNHSSQNTITITTELNTLKLYMELEALRFDESFDYSVSIEDHIDPDFDRIPPMLIQPYIENAIWHGLMLKKDGPGKITVELFRYDEQLLKCVITDNGIGIVRAMELKSMNSGDRQSSGMKVTKERLEILNDFVASPLSAEVEDLADDSGNATGTRVSIYIPFE